MVACLGDPELTAIVRHHHERLDGGGYPGGLLGMEIPVGARIVAVADTFDVIIEARPYRAASPHKRALDILVEETGTHFDPLVVDAFLTRYSGKRGLPIWAGLGALLARGVAWLNGGRPTARSQSAATVGVLAAIAAAALAAPLAQPGTRHRTATAAPPTAQVAAVTSTTTTAAFGVLGRRLT
jgi:hypothetical protein